MTTNLEIIHQKLEDRGQSEDIVWILIPRFALEVVRGRYHQHYYELSKVADLALRDHFHEVLDEGEAGMSDVLLMADFIARLDTMNGHLATANAHMANMAGALSSGMIDAGGTIGLTDAVLTAGGGGAWDDLEIADLVNAVELIGAAL